MMLKKLTAFLILQNGMGSGALHAQQLAPEMSAYDENEPSEQLGSPSKTNTKVSNPQDKPLQLIILKKKISEPIKEPVKALRKRRTQFRLGLGLAVVDESDDRFRPAVQLHFAWRRWSTKIHYLDRRSKLFRDQTYLLSATYHFLFGSVPFTNTKLFGGIGAGASYVRQQAYLDVRTEEESNYNLAAVFNLEFRRKWHQAVFSAGWESHIYPVKSATLFLVVTRRQALYLKADYRL